MVKLPSFLISNLRTDIRMVCNGSGDKDPRSSVINDGGTNYHGSNNCVCKIRWGIRSGGFGLRRLAPLRHLHVRTRIASKPKRSIAVKNAANRKRGTCVIPDGTLGNGTPRTIAVANIPIASNVQSNQVIIVSVADGRAGDKSPTRRSPRGVRQACAPQLDAVGRTSPVGRCVVSSWATCPGCWG